MKLTIFGANGPTGIEVCRLALEKGHMVTAAVRRPGEFPLQHKALSVIKADVTDGSSLAPAIGDADAVLSTLGTVYTRHEVRLYSLSSKAIVDAMRTSDHCRRLIIISSGMTVMPPKGRGFVEDYMILPLLRYVIGRTLYEDMARMETFVTACDDIAWTIMRPARLKDSTGVPKYRVDENFPVVGEISRQGLAAAMLEELGPKAHVHKKMAPSTILAI